MSAPPSSPPPRDDDTRSRLDREIDEILSGNDNIRHLPPPPRSPKPTPLKQPSPTIPPAVSRFLRVPIFLATVVAIVAYLLRDVSPLLANIGATIAVACIIWPVVQYFRRPKATPTTQMWRGQVFQTQSQPATTPIDSIRQWWNDRRR